VQMTCIPVIPFGRKCVMKKEKKGFATALHIQVK
jgi:hypothetical protein